MKVRLLEWVLNSNIKEGGREHDVFWFKKFRI